MKILFVGGGSLGPVTPLMATAQALKRLSPRATFVWIGTPDGPERGLVEKESIPFYALPVAKWPRYPSVRWITFPFDVMRAKKEARALVRSLKPDAVVTAGGFTAVPVVQVASAMGIPCFAHQLDVVPGLSNKHVAKLCISVTTSFEYERPPFGDRVSDMRIPTPTRFGEKDLPHKQEALGRFDLQPGTPVVLVVGGGTGAEFLNELVRRNMGRLRKSAQIIHVVGQGKGKGLKNAPGYVVRPLLDQAAMLDAYVAADVVVSRAGIGALSEIAALQKAAILIPLPGQQQVNARAFEEQGAAIVVAQPQHEKEIPAFDDAVLTDVELLLQDADEINALGQAAHKFFPTDDGTALAKRIEDAIKKEKSTARD